MSRLLKLFPAALASTLTPAFYYYYYVQRKLRFSWINQWVSALFDTKILFLVFLQISIPGLQIWVELGRWRNGVASFNASLIYWGGCYNFQPIHFDRSPPEDKEGNFHEGKMFNFLWRAPHLTIYRFESNKKFPNWSKKLCISTCWYFAQPKYSHIQRMNLKYFDLYFVSEGKDLMGGEGVRSGPAQIVLLKDS